MKPGAVGRQYSIRGSGGPPPARWAVACTLQRGLHRPPRRTKRSEDPADMTKSARTKGIAVFV